jgi:hypothetical protein
MGDGWAYRNRYTDMGNQTVGGINNVSAQKIMSVRTPAWAMGGLIGTGG